jgi:hypothetical protein
MRRKLPKLASNEAAESFVAASDLTDYDLSDMRMVRFEFQPEAERVKGRKETIHLLGNPFNAQRLIDSIREAEAGLTVEHDLVEPRSAIKT